MALFTRASTRARVFVIGTDHGQPVKVQVQPVPAGIDRQLRREAFDGVKARKAGNQPLVRQVERSDEYIARRAAHALVDTRNFNLLLDDAEAVARYAPLLKKELKPGEEVLLDGCWSDEVKEAFFEDFPMFADKVSDFASRISQAELEDEEESTEAF